jgi:glucose-1-phosphatase
MTSETGVELVVFDLGGVVCRFEPQSRLRALASSTGFDEEYIKEAIWTSGLDSAIDRGQYDLHDAIATVMETLEHRANEAALLEAWSSAFVVAPEVATLAHGLTRRPAIFTNNGPILEECLRRRLVDVSGIFEPILFAWRLGFTKPDPRSYERAASALGRNPTSLLLIDDSEANVSGARQSGWKAIRFHDVEQLDQELRDAGLVV